MRNVLAHLIALVITAAMTVMLGVPRSTGNPTAAPRQAERVSPCIPSFDQLVEPREVLPGETVDITLTASVTCLQASNIVLVVDASHDMAGTKGDILRAQAQAWIAHLGGSQHEGDQMAIVKVGREASVACDLTRDTAKLTACLDGIKWASTGVKSIEKGLDLSLTVLRKDPAWAAVRNVVVLLSDGANDSGCSSVLSAASRLKTAGIFTASICLGADCDAACMRQMATSPRSFWQIGAIGEARVPYDEVAGRFSVKRIVIIDMLAPAFTYVPHSADPEPDNVVGTDFTWQENYVPKDGLTITFRAQAPTTPGSYAVSTSAAGDVTDTDNRSRSAAFPNPSVRVLEPGQVPGTGGCAPLATSARAMPDEVTVGDPVSMTLTVSAGCARTALPVNAVLVVDSSGGTAWEPNLLIKKAVKQVIRDLKLDETPQYKLGLVRFGGTAETLCDLTNDAGELSSCANKLGYGGSAVLDAGLREGSRLLIAARPQPDIKPATTELLVLLSAVPNSTGCTPVLAGAEQAKALGITVATVCAGPACEQACLDPVSSSPADRYTLNTLPQLLDTPQWYRRDTIQRLTITHQLPADVLYVAGSANPVPSRGDPATSLVWDFASQPVTRADVTFALRPQLAGRQQVGVAWAEVQTVSGSPTLSTTFNLPMVDVLPAASPTPPPTATIMPTPPGHRLWLPTVWH